MNEVQGMEVCVSQNHESSLHTERYGTFAYFILLRPSIPHVILDVLQGENEVLLKVLNALLLPIGGFCHFPDEFIYLFDTYHKKG